VDSHAATAGGWLGTGSETPLSLIHSNGDVPSSSSMREMWPPKALVLLFLSFSLG